MRLLHTADWHLGKEWLGEERIKDMDNYVLPEIIDIALHEKVDLLVVAGDIFDGFGQKSVRYCTRLLKTHLQPLRSAGIHVAIIPGNHDSPSLFRLLEAALEINQLSGNAQTIIFTRPRIYDLGNIQILGIPYLSASNFRDVLQSEFPADTILQNQILSQQYEALLQIQKHKLVGFRPAVLIGHFSVSGARLKAENDWSGSEVSYTRDLAISTEMLLSNDQISQYNALGHIHLAQCVPETVVPTYYAGAPDYFERGQEKYEPQVLIVDLPERGKTLVRPIPLKQITPFIHETVTSREELDALAKRFDSQERRDRVLGDLIIKIDDPIDYVPLRDIAYQLFPRLHRTNTIRPQLPNEELSLQFETSDEYAGLTNPRITFDTYFTQNNYSEDRLSILREALDTILKELEDAN